MKSLMTNLLLVTMGLSVYSCNEKISPALESGNSTTTPTVEVPADYYFQVVNKSALVLNYKLHKTGAGNAAKPCQIKSPGVPLASTLYTGEGTAPHESKVYDISCFLEAEELSLYFNGLDFSVEASKNTCEYIAYTPFAFFDAIVGSSGATYRGIKCEEGTITSADAASFATTHNAVYGAGSIPVDCGFMVDISVPTAQRTQRIIPAENQTLCAYDYATNGGGNLQNCDLGSIKFNFIEVFNAQTDPLLPAIPAARSLSTANHSCGGTAVACVGGAIKHVPSIAGKVFGAEVLNTNLNQDFARTYKIPAAIGKALSNKHITNYRRGLASLDLNYLDYATINEPNWADTNYNRSFDPNLMEKYSANRNPDGSYIIDTAGSPSSAVNATVSNAAYLAKIRVNGWTNIPYTAEPFLGTGGFRVNPFYTFHCLDRSQETKARIRMVVRDWDRVFGSTASDMELLSDVYKSISGRRLDLPSDEVEIPGDPNIFNLYDDYEDWDALIPMTRDDPNAVQVYDPGDTTWGPTSGWWDSANFPNAGPFSP